MTRELTTKEAKKILKSALPASQKIDNIWNIQGLFFGYQIKGLNYPNRMKIVDGEAVLLN